jgi:hypothetical protein
MKTVGSVELMASMRDELRESNLQRILEALELVCIDAILAYFLSLKGVYTDALSPC